MDYFVRFYTDKYKYLILPIIIANINNKKYMSFLLESLLYIKFNIIPITNNTLLFNKESYEVSEYIYYRRNILGGLGSHVELYDLQNEDMVVYSDGISATVNEEYYKYLIENNYQVCLTEVSDYVEGHTGKGYYSLDEIRELEPQISESLKIINSAKIKTK